MDLFDLNIRPELHLNPCGTKLEKPHACYTLIMDERRDFCRFLKSVKFRDGYAANNSMNVNVKDDKISELKTHDCHVLLQRFLPVGIHRY